MIVDMTTIKIVAINKVGSSMNNVVKSVTTGDPDIPGPIFNLTNYSTGPVIIYFGNGYSSASNWFKIGFLISLYHLIIWLGFGSLWWKVIGWW